MSVHQFFIDMNKVARETSDHSHLEPIHIHRKILLNPDNCRTKDTSSILFDNQSFEEYCLELRLKKIVTLQKLPDYVNKFNRKNQK